MQTNKYTFGSSGLGEEVNLAMASVLDNNGYLESASFGADGSFTYKMSEQGKIDGDTIYTIKIRVKDKQLADKKKKSVLFEGEIDTPYGLKNEMAEKLLTTVNKALKAQLKGKEKQ